MIVTTQDELDQALANGDNDIEIRSPRNVGLYVGGSAYGSVTVRAFDSVTVTATGSATVHAYRSATVTAFDSATVTATGSVTVRAFDSVTVTATGSATVHAFDSATVRATGFATVTATGSATVTAFDSTTVTAGSHAVIHVHSRHVQRTGGVVVDHTAVRETDVTEWAAYHGVTVNDATATLYKAVRSDLRSAWGMLYPIGETVTCDDWEATNECGGGLHFSPSPSEAARYDDDATRWLECEIGISDLLPIPSGVAKCKVPRATVVREVDIMGRPLRGDAR